MACRALPARSCSLLGDSITCGAAVDRVPGETKAGASWANPRASYGMLMAKQLNAQVQLVCYGGRGLVRTWDGKTNDLNLPTTTTWRFLRSRSPCRGISATTAGRHRGRHRHQRYDRGIVEREPYVQAYVKLVRTLLQDHPQAQIMLTEGGMLHTEKQAALRSYIAETVRVVGDPRVHAIASTGYPGDAVDSHPTREQSISIANDLLPQVRAYALVSRCPNSGASSTISTPLKIMVRLATAPCAPIERALLKPKPCAAAPYGAPRAIRMRSGRIASSVCPSRIPNKPVMMTNTPVSCAEPPRWRVASSANGVDTERASRLCAMLPCRPSRRSSSSVLPSDAAMPATLPSVKASQCRRTNSRY
jgi:hypothetical protein